MKSTIRTGGQNWLTPLLTIGLISVSVPIFAAIPNSADDVAAVLKRQGNGQLQHWKAETSVFESKDDAEFPKYDWWKSFQDPALDQAIGAALDGNPSLKSIATQIASAEARAKIARSPLMPALTFDPLYTREKLSKNQYFFPIQGRNFQVFQLPLDTSYEVDFFGKNTAIYHSAKEQIKVAGHQYEAARIQLTGQVASTYFNIAKWRYMEGLAQQQLISSDKLLRHDRDLLELGQATIFDIQNSQQRRDLAQVNVSQFANNRLLAENQLLALQGLSPSNHPAPQVSQLENLNAPSHFDIGVPSQLVLHRPDVAATETQLKSGSLDIKAARRALLPRIMLTGSMGYNAIGVKNVFNWSSLSSFVTAAASQPIFNGGRLRAQIKLQKAAYQQMLYNYETTLLGAFTEVENSLSTLHADQIVYRDIKNQTENARLKAERHRQMVNAGLEGEPIFLAEDVQRIEYEKQLTQQKVQVLIDSVSLAKALGGGY